MSTGLVILIICLLVLGVALRIGGVVLSVLFLCLAGWLVITMLVRFAAWVVGEEEAALPPGQAFDPDRDAGGMGETRVCPDPHCGRVNEARARFCGQCGRLLG